MHNPWQAPGGRRRVAQEARVDAPLFGGSQSAAPVSVRATHRGGSTELGPVRQGVCAGEGNCGVHNLCLLQAQEWSAA